MRNVSWFCPKGEESRPRNPGHRSGAQPELLTSAVRRLVSCAWAGKWDAPAGFDHGVYAPDPCPCRPAGAGLQPPAAAGGDRGGETPGAPFGRTAMQVPEHLGAGKMLWRIGSLSANAAVKRLGVARNTFLKRDEAVKGADLPAKRSLPAGLLGRDPTGKKPQSVSERAKTRIDNCSRLCYIIQDQM